MPTLFGVVVVTFILTRALPGDPAAYFAGPAATPESIAQVRAALGLDKPLPAQFVRYRIVEGLELDARARRRLDASVAELVAERDAVEALGLL